MSVEYFVGRWQIARDIVDRRACTSGSFRGFAEFGHDEAGVRWLEDGELTWADHHVSAGRRLRMAPGTSGVDVFFDDGRYFHSIDIVDGGAQFTHDCAPDTYAGNLLITSNDWFVITWDVEGPATALTITSSYQRVGRSSA